MNILDLDDLAESKIPTLEQNHVFLFHKDFEPDSCAEAMRFILERNLMPSGRPPFMKFIFNSYGGNVHSEFALIDTMRGSKIPIHTYGLGIIASAGLGAFMAGAKGHRFITKNTSILSHQFSWGSGGKEHELFASVREFQLTSERMIEHYRKCTGLSVKKIKDVLLPPEDRWLSAQEAVQYGLADKIVEFK